jgi:hypothetical protein
MRLNGMKSECRGKFLIVAAFSFLVFTEEIKLKSYKSR